MYTNNIFQELRIKGEFMQEIQIKLAVFEGPLDLLLHLIQKLELDIYDIPIAQVTDQYMHYIRAMKEFELSLAGEYLVMAATLMAIKSQMLLPTNDFEYDDLEEAYEEDPREALVTQLLEYRKYKYAADCLVEKAEERQNYYSKEPMNVEAYKSEEIPTLKENQLTTIDLFLAFHSLLEKRKFAQPSQTTITAEETTIEEKMQWVKKTLAHISKDQGLPLSKLLIHYTKTEIVLTFLALLELMKKQEIRVEQIDNQHEMMLYKVGV